MELNKNKRQKSLILELRTQRNFFKQVDKGVKNEHYEQRKGAIPNSL